MKTNAAGIFRRNTLPVVLSLLLVAGCGRQADNLSVADKQTLFSSSTRIRGFDPVKAGDVSTAMAVGKVYEGLYQYDYYARPYRLLPLLAASMPQVSSNGLIYTIPIQPGIHFHDDPCFANGNGRELVAEDFVYALKRIADVKTGSSGYWIFRGRIEGLDAFREASMSSETTDYALPVAGLQALDKYTLQIRLTRPYPQLLWILAMPYAVAVPYEAVEMYGDDFMAHPVGTGPYMLQEWRRNYRLEYLANPHWKPRSVEAVDETRVRLDLNGQETALPGLTRIVQYVMDDSSTRWLAFLNGQLDLYADIARDNWDVVFTPDQKLNQTLAEKGIVLHSIAGLNVYYIGFNMDDPVVGANRKLRQALTCAFNSKEWVEYYNGRVVRAHCPIPPGVAGHVTNRPGLRFDLERAKQLLAVAGYPEGIDPQTGRRLTLALELGKTDTEMRESTELFAAFMRRIGVVIEPSYNNKPAFFEKVEKRQAQLFRLSWFADYPDGQNFLQLFYSPNASPGPNRVNYNNPEYDQLYEKASVMQDSPERTALYRQLAEMVMQDCPWIFTHYPVDYSLTRDTLRNYYPHDFPYGMEKYYRK